MTHTEIAKELREMADTFRTKSSAFLLAAADIVEKTGTLVAENARLRDERNAAIKTQSPAMAVRRAAMQSDVTTDISCDALLANFSLQRMINDNESFIENNPVAVLFARRDSIYKGMENVDVWDADRDALKWPGGTSIVAHPPCRAWSQLRHFAKPRTGEKELALWAVEQVRRWGGVLEHPAKSALWPAANLPEPGERDEWGGWTYALPQMWFGHWCEKATRLYIVGCSPDELPAVPLVLGEATHVQTYSHKCRTRPQLPPSMREKTPPAFAEWLLDVARIAESKNSVDLGEIRAGHVCKHGIRWPHYCAPCSEAAWIRNDILANDQSHQSRPK